MKDVVLPTRPKQVDRAIKLLYLVFVIGIVKLIFIDFEIVDKSLGPINVFLAIEVFVLLLIFFFIYNIGRGHNWARITILILFIISLFHIPNILKDLQTDLIVGVLGSLQIPLNLIVLILLFKKESSDWFKKIKLRRKGT